MLQEHRCWIVLIVISLLGAAILQFHVLHWDLLASFSTTIFVFLFGVFTKEIIQKEIRATFIIFAEQSDAEKGPGG